MTNHTIAPANREETAAVLGQLFGIDPALIPAAFLDVMVEIEDALLALDVATDKEAARDDLKQALGPLVAIMSAAGQAPAQGGRHD